MDDAVGDLDAAEMGSQEAAEELVVVARNIDNSRALAALAQDLLNHIVVELRPVPRPLQPPAIRNVADQVNRLGVIVLQEVEQKIRLAPARAQDVHLK
jgi:hypothetical protein